MLLLPPQAPPALVQPAPQASWPGLDGFLAARVTADSRPGLVAALKNLYRDSPRFRTLLGDFHREQPRVKLSLQTTTRPTSGDITVYKSGEGYVLFLLVQELPAARNLDRIEPWLGALVFVALEVARKGDVQEMDAQHFEFSAALVRGMWAEQRELRRELRKLHREAYRDLAANGEWLYQSEVLGQAYGPKSP